MKTKTTLTLMAGLTGLLALPMSAQENTPPPGPVETVKPLPDLSALLKLLPPGGIDLKSLDPEICRVLQEAATMIDPQALAQFAGHPSVGNAVAATLGPKGTVSWTAVNGGDMIHERLNSGPVTFLGVMTTQVSPEISTHLALEENTGLVVEYLDKDGPAGKAGLEKGDILAKLDDQILILPQQLRVLVENKKEGDAIKLSILRKGKAEEVTVTLAKKEPTAEPKDGRFRLGGVDVVIDAEEGRPLRTFLKRLAPPPGVPGATVPPAPPMPPGVGVEVKPEAAVGKADVSVEERLEKIEAMLEKLAKEKE